MNTNTYIYSQDDLIESLKNYKKDAFLSKKNFETILYFASYFSGLSVDKLIELMKTKEE